MSKLVAMSLCTSIIAAGCGGTQSKPSTPPTPKTINVGTAAKANADAASAGVPSKVAGSVAPAKPMSTAAEEVLISPWHGPYGGVPQFDLVNPAGFRKAVDLAIAANVKEIDAIANSSEPPTFANTIEALEKAGTMLDRVQTYLGIWISNLSTPQIQAIEEEVGPLLAANDTAIILNAKLWKRVEAVYTSAEYKTLGAEAKRITWYYYTQFSLAGAKLDAKAKEALAIVNQDLSKLYSQFSKNQLADEEKTLELTKKEELAGLEPDFIAGAAALAKEKGKAGAWLFANTRSAMEPLLTYASNRSVRERAFAMFTKRGDNGDGNDNNQLAAHILQLRAKKAKLLGSKTYADLHLLDTMAQKPANAMKLMMQVWKPAVAAVKRDVAEMQKMIDAEKGGFALAAWDYRYYAEKLRKAKFDLDLGEVKPYLQVESLREAMFWVANQIYGFSFKPVTNVPVFHADVRVYEVLDRDNKHVGLWYFDPWARSGKRSGAWMNDYRAQQKLVGNIATIVSNNSNFIKPTGNAPATISWTDARTMFHEFGHALHGLNSKVTYPSLSGTNTMRDHVEFPSQVNEGWLSAEVVQNKFLKNEKGQTIPKELIEKLNKASTFNSGFSTVEGLASAIIDMKLHLTTATVDTKAFEAKELKALGMPSQIVMRHRIPHFGHVFSGDGYAAGYYGYIWADVLARDAYEAFTETGNPFDPAVSKKLHDFVMSVGNTIDSAEGFRKFRGRDPKADALLRSRGFPTK